MVDIILFTANRDAYAPRRLSEECKKLGKKILVVHYRDLKTVITKGRQLEIYASGIQLPDTKGVFLRGLGEDHEYNPLKYAVLLYFARMGTKVINSRSFYRWPSLDKTIQQLEMQKGKIPFIDSKFYGSKEMVIKDLSESLDFPVIIKDYVGSCGNQVFKIEDKNTLRKFLNPFTLRQIKTQLFQRFLSGGADIRVIYLDGKVLGAMKRIAKKGSFLTNYSQGGDVVEFDLKDNPEIKDIALKTASYFMLDYAGIDLMRDENGEWLVLEINRACQFKGFEKATKINVAREITNYLAK